MKLRIGDIYSVDSLDHWQSANQPEAQKDASLILRTRGVLVSVTKRQIVLEVQSYVDDASGRADRYGILRSTITRIRRVGRE